MIASDPDCLASIISNLLSNAVQYSTPDSTILCRAKSDTPTGKFALSISNPTDGLTQEDLPHMAEPFWRKSEARSPDDHSGLGLALVKAYAAVLHLTVNFSLNDQNIFTATIELPAIAQSSATPAIVAL
jgi:signal transduction histidine kinase